MNFTPARMGQFVQTYRPPVFSPHAQINALLAPPRRMLKTFEGAVLTKGKEFPDVSYYQGLINWDQMRAMTDAVIIRAGQNLYLDTQFKRNWAEAKARGMIRGLYWFYDGRADPLKQAELLAASIAGDLPEMEVVVDWETNYGGAFEGLPNVVKFMQRIEQLLPVKTMFYTGYYWFVNNSNALTHAAQYDFLKTRPLWLAWYTLDPSLVLVPKPWASLWLWQWGTPLVGAQYGVETANIDMNWFNGTQDSFYYYYGQPLPQPPTGGTMTQYQVIGTQGLNLRAGPATSFGVLRLVPTGSMIWGIKDATTGWIAGTKYQEPNGVETPLAFFCSSLGTLVKEYTPPPPPAKPSVFVTHTFNDTLTVNGVTYTATFTVPNVEYKPNP